MRAGAVVGAYGIHVPETVMECPITSCRWELRYGATLPAEVHQAAADLEPDTPFDPADPFRLHVKAVNTVIERHLETHTLLEWVQEVARLRGELAEATADAHGETGKG